MNILFLGQKPIGESCFRLLENIQNENIKIVGAVSNMSSNTVWWNTNEIYKSCIEKNVSFIDNIKKNEEAILQLIKEKDVDFIISIGHSWILSDEVLKSVNYQAINLHLAKLPEYKGNYTYNHAILNGEKEYGVTLHWMDSQVDQGDYVYTEKFDILSSDTAYSLYEKSLKAGMRIFAKALEDLVKNRKLPRIPMKRGGHFYGKHSLDGKRNIQNVFDVNEIQKKSRAFYFPPFENAYFFFGGIKYYVIPASEEKRK